MTKKKLTKRALLLSALSLLMCVSMLIGSTYAWFTDSVTSGNNKIIAGNLDIGVYYAYPSDVVNGDIPDENWKPVTADKSLFNKDALWEPGYTEAVFLKFENEGTLALQYQLQVDILKEVIGKTKDGADIQLSNYINAYACNSFQWDYTYYLFTERNDATNPAGAPNPYYDTLYNAANGKVNTPNNENPLSLDSWQWLDPTETTYATLVLWMPDDVGNEANHNGEDVPSIDLGISVVATQYTWEKDSFGDDYDKDANLPIIANSAESLLAALATGGKVKLENDVVIPANLLTNDASIASIPVGMYINKDTVLDLNGHDIIMADNDAGCTVALFVKDADLTITGSGNIKQEGHDDYLLWAKGASTVTINDGVFETGSGDSSVLYASGNTAWDPTDDYATINIYGGTFISGNPSDDQDNANVMNHGVGRINYYGGTFNWDPSTLKGDDAPYIKVAEGYKAASNGSSWIVIPETAELATDNATFSTAIQNGADIVYLGSGDYIIPAAAKGKTLTIVGTGDTSVAVTKVGNGGENCDFGLDGSTVVFENVTITTNSSTYIGYARCNGTYNNCTINGTYTLYGNSLFNNCTFNVSGDVYNIWTWGAPTATFNNCTFNSDGKAVLLYGTANTKLTVNGCTFNDNGGLTDLKAAIEIGNDYGKSYELIVNDTTVNGYEINDKGINTGSTLWANKNSMGQDKLNVVVDGVDVY